MEERTIMKPAKLVTAMAALTAFAAVLAPPAKAEVIMAPGNYDLLTNRYTVPAPHPQASWVWFVSPCHPDKQYNCVDVSAIPRLKFYAYYDGNAYLANGRYTLTVDVPDGLRCPGHSMPTRETYSWDAVTLAGTIDSRYNVGCFNGPPGSQFWTFALQRL
jgi:hypothetical protein